MEARTPLQGAPPSNPHLLGGGGGGTQSLGLGSLQPPLQPPLQLQQAALGPGQQQQQRLGGVRGGGRGGLSIL